MQRFRVVPDTVEYPLVTCIFWYTHEPLGECAYQESTNDEWDMKRVAKLFYNMP